MRSSAAKMGRTKHEKSLSARNNGMYGNDFHRRGKDGFPYRDIRMMMNNQ